MDREAYQLDTCEEDRSEDTDQCDETKPRGPIDEPTELTEGALGERHMALDLDLALQDRLESGDQLRGGLEAASWVLLETLRHEVEQLGGWSSRHVEQLERAEVLRLYRVEHHIERFFAREVVFETQ